MKKRYIFEWFSWWAATDSNRGPSRCKRPNLPKKLNKTSAFRQITNGTCPERHRNERGFTIDGLLNAWDRLSAGTVPVSSHPLLYIAVDLLRQARAPGIITGGVRA